MTQLIFPTVFLCAASSASATLILSAIYDGGGSTPKGVEIYVTSTGSYDGWTVDTESNANIGFNVGYTFDMTTYTIGDLIYLTSTDSDPLITGAGGIIIADSSFNQNGDDRLRITDGTNVIDQYGDSGTDGTGLPWEYTDSYAIRKSGTTASGVFVLEDWDVAPINSLDNGNDALGSALGNYDPVAVPEPSSALLGGLALLGLLRRKR